MSEHTRGKLGGIWASIREEIVDLGTIDVTTLEGQVELELSSDQVFNLDELFKALKARVDEDTSRLSLVAHTHIDFDLDSVMVARPDPSAPLMEAHDRAVQTAVEARVAVLELAREVAGL